MKSLRICIYIPTIYPMNHNRLPLHYYLTRLTSMSSYFVLAGRFDNFMSSFGL